jgi:pyrrolidone-carboxylate peptidase
MALSKCKVLLMGYTNYRQYLWNPAELIVDSLNGSEIERCRIIGIKLPVSFMKVRENVPKYLKEEDPQIALGIGLNPTVKKVILELASSNLVSFEVEDEEGFKVEFGYVKNDELRVLQTRLPVKRIYEVCAKNKMLPIKPSVGIGSYLCNTLGYLIMEWAWDTKRLGGFVHVPSHTDLALKLGLSNYLDFKTILDSIKCILRETVKELS